MVIYTFNSSTWEVEAGKSEFETSLVYRARSRPVRATQRNPVSKNKDKTNLKNVNFIKNFMLVYSVF